MFKLFIGFKELGEFATIMEAKKYAVRCGLSGMFNLIGSDYWDSWYVTQIEAKENQKKYENEDDPGIN